MRVRLRPIGKLRHAGMIFSRKEQVISLLVPLPHLLLPLPLVKPIHNKKQAKLKIVRCFEVENRSNLFCLVKFQCRLTGQTGPWTQVTVSGIVQMWEEL